MSISREGDRSLLEQDLTRYPNKKNMPRFQWFYRKAQGCRFKSLKFLYRCLFKIFRDKNLVEISLDCQIGGGLYLGHAYCITINPEAKIGQNCNIHKGVTIGQENRGVRKGVPTIGDDVWIGINSTIVGNIVIENDVLIAPNTYVNCDVPMHSVVYGNPCVIKHRENATQGYINRRIELT